MSMDQYRRSRGLVTVTSLSPRVSETLNRMPVIQSGSALGSNNIKDATIRHQADGCFGQIQQFRDARSCENKILHAVR